MVRTGLPARKGCYVLLICLDEGKRVRVGELYDGWFEPGIYLYCGSALGGLSPRVGRHFSLEKRRRWHVDHLLDVAKVFGALLFMEGEADECGLSRTLETLGLETPVKGFGSSDCSCRSHLYLLRDESRLEGLLAILDRCRSQIGEEIV